MRPSSEAAVVILKRYLW